MLVKNVTGSTMTPGQVVYVSGVTLGIPDVQLARANASTTLPALGVVMDSILTTAIGQVMIGGIATFDTTTFSTGNQLYVSTTAAGALQNTRPSGTSAKFVQRIGTVMTSGASGTVILAIAPFIGNLETGTTAATWTGNAVVATTYNGNTFTTGTGVLTLAAAKTLTASNTITLSGTDGVAMNVSNNKIAQITGFIGDGVNNIATNATSFAIPCTFAGAITGWTIAADAGTCTIKTWKKATGTAIPAIGDVISTSGVALATGTLIRSSTVTDFTTTTVTANDVFIFVVTAVGTPMKWISFTLEITKT